MDHKLKDTIGNPARKIQIGSSDWHGRARDEEGEHRAIIGVLNVDENYHGGHVLVCTAQEADYGLF